MWSFNPRTHIGCDRVCTHPHARRRCFNPRTHIGCDLMQDVRPLEADPFQSTHPHRVRLLSNTDDLGLTKFQSTHPHRVRLLRVLIEYKSKCFNPRTHIGCDRVFSKCLNITLQSYNFCGSLQNNTIKTLIFL